MMRDLDSALDPEPVENIGSWDDTTQTKEDMHPKKAQVIGIILGALLLGIGSGFSGWQLFPMNKASQGASKEQLTQQAQAGLQVGQLFGNPDSSNFRDSALGFVVKGGVNGEGSHHIAREGGKSQNVYLTSSVVDLDQFIGHSVEVRGETFRAQKAGWLMDVGQLKIVELNAQPPAWLQQEMEAAGLSQE